MNKRLAKCLMAGASPLTVLMMSGPGFAQSTGTQAVEGIESITVTGEVYSGGGIMKPITVPKERSTITQDFINTQPAGQSVFDALNKVPGYNFTNNDPYGNSGGNIRVHGFDGNHISFTWDGMPLNDTGNYAIFTNQVADSEIIASASVNQGTTDVDSPTASATGGVVSITTSRPNQEWGAMMDTSFGSNNYKREFLRLDTGEFGPWHTTAFVSGSYTSYDKFKGPGFLQKKQVNAVIFQDLGDLGWVQLAMHWNSNRNNFYNNPTFYPTVSTLQIVGGIPTGVTPFPLVSGGPAAPNIAYSPAGNFTGTGAVNNALGFGLKWDEAPTCTRVAGGGGGRAARQSLHQFLWRAHQSFRHRQYPPFLAFAHRRGSDADGGPQHPICAGQWRRLYLAQRNRSPAGGFAPSRRSWRGYQWRRRYIGHDRCLQPQ